MAAGNVPTTNINALYTNTTAGTAASPTVMDAAIADIVATINDNYAYAAGLVQANKLSDMGIVNVKDYGAVGDGVTDDAAAFESAISAVSAAGGGVLYAPPGDYLFSGDNYLNIKEKVTVRGAGYATRFISGTGGKNGHHSFVYLKDNAAIEHCCISGSDYIRQSGGADYIAYNKIGITTQGASTGRGFRVSHVGFEKMLNSHIYVHDGHSDVLVEDCYTFGTQVGVYAEIDANYEVTNWNATMDAGKLSAGTQAYCLTNFYNSGSSSASSDVVITGGRHLNINDAFVGINGNGKRHIITNNVSVKNATGYYGGWGVDVNTGDENVVTGNYLEGYTAGCHLYGARNCAVTGNVFKTDIGVWIEDVTSVKNTVTGNTMRLTENNPSVTNKMGVKITQAQNNDVVGNMVDGNSISGSKGVYLETSALGNNIGANTFANLDVGIESQDSNSDSNYAYVNVFRSVTTKFPRAILSNHFQNVRGISGTDSNANNMGGTVTISNTNSSQAVTFTNAEPDTNYRILLTVRSVSGSPASGAYTTLAPSAKTINGFTVNLSAAPGAGTSISYDWFLFRA